MAYAVERLTAEGGSETPRHWWSGNNWQGTPLCTPEPKRAYVWATADEAHEAVAGLGEHLYPRYRIVAAPSRGAPEKERQPC